MDAAVRWLAFACLPLAACGTSSSSGGDPPPSGDGDSPAPGFVIVDHPSLHGGANFGETVLSADLDQDGDLDLLIAAPGEGVVYLALRAGPEHDPRWEISAAIGPGGQVDLPVTDLADTGFGFSLALAEVDGDPEPELIVGAPNRNQGEGSAFLFGVGGALTDAPISVPAPAGGKFGTGVALGDLTGDGEVDLVISATHAQVAGFDAGSAWFYEGPLGPGLSPTFELPNPNPVDNGNFGLHLAVDLVPGELVPSLYLAAPGNDHSLGYPAAGQIVSYPGPIDPLNFWLAEDPGASLFDFPRFGMHIAADSGYLLVGAPRKDLGPFLDAGLGFVFDASAGGVTEHRRQQPEVKDLLGFRVAIGDLVGDSTPDNLFLLLHNRQLLIWDGADPGGDPQVLEALGDAGDHSGMGLHVADLMEAPRDEVVLGDPSWDRPGHGAEDDVGRVVIHRHRK